jgi:membrane protease YdiL (CAAX protease family)
MDGDDAARRPQGGAPSRLVDFSWKPVGLFYGATMVAAGALDAAQPWAKLDEQILQLVQFAPAVAVGLVLVVFRGPARPRLVIGGGTWSSAVAGLLRLVAAAVAVFALCSAAYVVVGQHMSVLRIGDLAAPLAVTVLAQWIGACGEELGWRCLLQPLLERRWPTVTASVVVGLLWGAWHIQVFTHGAFFALGFLLGTVALSVIMGVSIRRRPGHNLLFASVLHLLINLGLLFAMDEENGQAVPMVAFGVACVTVCAVFTMWPIGHEREHIS